MRINKFKLIGDVGCMMLTRIEQAIYFHNVLNTKTKACELLINSPGGVVQDGLEIISLLKENYKHIHVVVEEAHSMAGIIASNGSYIKVKPDGILHAHTARTIQNNKLIVGKSRKYGGNLHQHMLYLMGRILSRNAFKSFTKEMKLAFCKGEDIYFKEYIKPKGFSELQIQRLEAIAEIVNSLREVEVLPELTNL